MTVKYLFKLDSNGKACEVFAIGTKVRMRDPELSKYVGTIDSYYYLDRAKGWLSRLPYRVIWKASSSKRSELSLSLWPNPDALVPLEV